MYYCGSLSDHLGPSAFNKLNRKTELKPSVKIAVYAQ